MAAGVFNYLAGRQACMYVCMYASFVRAYGVEFQPIMVFQSTHADDQQQQMWQQLGVCMCRVVDAFTCSLACS
jgi:hypothetical protein